MNADFIIIVTAVLALLISLIFWLNIWEVVI